MVCYKQYSSRFLKLNYFLFFIFIFQLFSTQSSYFWLEIWFGWMFIKTSNVFSWNACQYLALDYCAKTKEMLKVPIYQASNAEMISYQYLLKIKTIFVLHKKAGSVIRCSCSPQHMESPSTVAGNSWSTTHRHYSTCSKLMELSLSRSVCVMTPRSCRPRNIAVLTRSSSQFPTMEIMRSNGICNLGNISTTLLARYENSLHSWQI